MKLAVVAADYTPGEADQLRRDMAAWRRSGRLERHRDKLIRRMMARGIEREFAQRVFEQIRGFGDYGFPESHAASFACIAYVTAWLKCHYPDVFTCALLNAQPMGFYSPATLIDDARRHGVNVLPVNVQSSEWDCTLVRMPQSLSNLGRRRPGDTGVCQYAVQVGLRYVKGLSSKSGIRIVTARDNAGFQTIDDFVTRTGCNDGTLIRLAEAGAFETIEGKRRDALWAAHAARHDPTPQLPVDEHDGKVTFASLDAFETITWDYESTGHSPRGHLLEPLRSALRARGFPDAKTIASMPDGSRVRYAGIVITRQRPGTAKGVVFMTMEDETGFVNIVLWSDVFERHAILAKTSSFLGVSGRIQSESGVVHVVADSLWSPGLPAKPQRPRSRDFH